MDWSSIVIKNILMGIGVFVFGFVLVTLCSSIFESGNVEFSYYYGITFSVLYLSAIMAISTSLIIKEIRNKQHNEK